MQAVRKIPTGCLEVNSPIRCREPRHKDPPRPSRRSVDRRPAAVGRTRLCRRLDARDRRSRRRHPRRDVPPVPGQGEALPRGPRGRRDRCDRAAGQPSSRPSNPKSPADALRISADAWLDIASEPEVRQLVLLDAPSVLGWAGFREISLRYGLGLTEQLLQRRNRRRPAQAPAHRPLATVMIGALDEAAMSIANADDPEEEKADVRAVIHNLIDGLLSNPDRAASARDRP